MNSYNIDQMYKTDIILALKKLDVGFNGKDKKEVLFDQLIKSDPNGTWEAFDGREVKAKEAQSVIESPFEAPTVTNTETTSIDLGPHAVPDKFR